MANRSSGTVGDRVVKFHVRVSTILTLPPLLLPIHVVETEAFGKLTSGYGTPRLETSAPVKLSRAHDKTISLFLKGNKRSVKRHKVKKVLEAHPYRYEQYNTPSIRVYMEKCSPR